MGKCVVIVNPKRLLYRLHIHVSIPDPYQMSMARIRETYKNPEIEMNMLKILTLSI